jgi:hypothetical protein
VVRNSVAGLGFAPDIPMVVFPIEMFLVESDISAVERNFMQFAEGLTSWSPPPQVKATKKLPMIRVEGADYEEAHANFNALYLKRRWGDGLPLVPPTPKRVDWILRGTDDAPDTEIGKFQPRGGIVTVETLAVALAMAGGRPEYLPVLEAAVRAVFDPELDHGGWQATSSSTFPAVVVNGKVAREIRVNSGFGLVGPDPKNPAGASIGRALRLLQQNVGGALPGVGTMAMFGHMRYTNAVFAEDEEGLPEGWPAFNVERFGLAPGSNSVSVNVCSSASNIIRRGIGTETLEVEAAASLRRIASYMRAVNANCFAAWEEGTPGVLVMSRPIARQLAAQGWTKPKIREFLWQHARLSLKELEETGMPAWMQRSGLQPPYQDPWPVTAKPENIAIVVAGGFHPTHNLWMQTSIARQMTSCEIRLPRCWEELVKQGEKDLGYGVD